MQTKVEKIETEAFGDLFVQISPSDIFQGASTVTSIFNSLIEAAT